MLFETLYFRQNSFQKEGTSIGDVALYCIVQRGIICNLSPKIELNEIFSIL